MKGDIPRLVYWCGVLTPQSSAQSNWPSHCVSRNEATFFFVSIKNIINNIMNFHYQSDTEH